MALLGWMVVPWQVSVDSRTLSSHDRCRGPKVVFLFCVAELDHKSLASRNRPRNLDDEGYRYGGYDAKLIEGAILR